MNSQKAQIHEENKGCRKEAKILAFTYAVTRFFFFFLKIWIRNSDIMLGIPFRVVKAF